MYTLTEDQYSFYSDAHKDAYGFRPMGRPSYGNKDEYDQDIAYMCDLISRQIEDGRRERRISLSKLFSRLRELMETHSIDLQTALRWDIDAEDARHGNHIDVGYYCYLVGISYMHEKRIGKILNIPFYMNL